MSKSERAPLVSTFWLTAWAGMLAWSWVLPNHYPPWAAFHMDFWAAVSFSVIAFAVMMRTRGEGRLSALCLATILVSLVPGVQFAAGVVLFKGIALTSSLYLLGFGIAVLVGQRWEARTPSQAGTALFVAICVASFISVGLQLHQWLQLNRIEVWSMGEPVRRPYANIGQPNQLGTLLLWGIIGLGWASLRGRLRPAIAIAGSVFLLWGVALTGSRTAWLGALLILAGAIFWRQHWPWRRTPVAVFGLVISLLFFIWAEPRVLESLLLRTGADFSETVSPSSGMVRLQMWEIFADALWRSPWFGYGWSQVQLAQLAASTDHAPLLIVFNHSHNIVLELMLWCGIPIGILVTLFMGRWLWTRFANINDAEAAMLFMLLVVVLNHAMVELPLHYAYFLLPVGLVMGALDAKLGARLFRTRIPVGLAAWVISALLLILVLRDYLRVEASYEALRFEWANIQSKAPLGPPEVLLLDQLRDNIVLAREEPTSDMESRRLDWMEHVVSMYPSAGNVHRLAVALAWNGRPVDAHRWLQRMCAVSAPPDCAAVERAWKMQAASDPKIAAVKWRSG